MATKFAIFCFLLAREVEASCKNILKENGVDSSSTTDYVKLLKAMKLNEYGVNLNFYPWIEQFRPFENWSDQSKSPSKDLVWYDAYNKIKHDREQNFPRATLDNAFRAVAACFILLCAQYGWDFAYRGREAERAFFTLTATPTWQPWQRYIGPMRGGSFVPKLYPFTAHS